MFGARMSCINGQRKLEIAAHVHGACMNRPASQLHALKAWPWASQIHTELLGAVARAQLMMSRRHCFSGVAGCRWLAGLHPTSDTDNVESMHDQNTSISSFTSDVFKSNKNNSALLIHPVHVIHLWGYFTRNLWSDLAVSVYFGFRSGHARGLIDGSACDFPTSH